MKHKDTTKKDKKPSDTAIETSTPLGHEELEANWIAEQKNTDTPPDKLQPKRDTHERKELKEEQPLNPKRVGNSRPD